MANLPSPDSLSSPNNNSTIELLDGFPFSPLQNNSDTEKSEPTLPPPPPPPPQKLPVIINTNTIANQHLPKVVQLSKGNVVYIQSPNNPNKTQTNFVQLTNCLPTILINTLPTSTRSEETKVTITPTTTSVEELPMDDIDCREYISIYLFSIQTIVDTDIDHLPMTPSTSSESPDERTTTSPDTTRDTNYSKNSSHRHQPYRFNRNSSAMVTNLEVILLCCRLLLSY